MKRRKNREMKKFRNGQIYRQRDKKRVFASKIKISSNIQNIKGQGQQQNKIK